MPAEVNGPIGWNLDSDSEIEAPEYAKKYSEVLTELSKFVGAAANTGDIEAYRFLVHYTTLIMQSGFELLKEVIDDKKSKNLQEFMKKIGILKNK